MITIRRRRRGRGLAVALLAAVSLTGSLVVGGQPAAAADASYSATQTIPVPPASNYAGGGGGDGWAIALTPTAVYNVFHHDSSLRVACHLQADASPCWSPKTVVDDQGTGFWTANSVGLQMDQATERLYVYATRHDSTAGVVCVDTRAAAQDQPYCGFTALTAAGEATSGGYGLSAGSLVEKRWYAFNYVAGSTPSGARNALLCFDLTTTAACAGQPFNVLVGPGTVDVGYLAPSVAAIGTRVIVPVITDGQERLACFDTTTGSGCAGAWPVAGPGSYAGQNGSPFPRLDAGGAVTGFCLPTGSNPCYDLTGAVAPTPEGLRSVVGASSPYNGEAFVLGPRTYVPNGNANQVECFDWSSGATCPGFPRALPNAGYMYTVNPDPARPTCVWVNADNGSAQIQNFDAYTGGACGQGPIRVLASSIVVPRDECRPTRYASLQVTSPARGSYSSGTVTFVDGNDREIPDVDPLPLDQDGRVSLTGLALNTSAGLPQFLITLEGAQGETGSVSVVLTWTGSASSTCDPSGERARLVHVALGDSYSSGEGAPPFEDGTNYPFVDQQENTLTYGAGATSCHRSLTNYAKLAAPKLDPELRPLLVDRTCSGATIIPGSGAKGAISPTRHSVTRDDDQVAQARAVLARGGRDADSVQLVTVTMGGNDAGFGSLVAACLAPNILRTMLDRYEDAPGELKSLAGRVGCKQFDDLFVKSSERIRRLQGLEVQAQDGLLSSFPNAQVLQLTYPGIVPARGQFAGDSCGGVIANDAAYVRDKVKAINDSIRGAARSQGEARLRVVDVESAFPGSPLCPADPSKALANGIDQAKLVTTVDALLVQGTESRRLLDELKDAYVHWRGCAVCPGRWSAVTGAFDALKAYFTPDKLESLVASLAEGATPEQRFDASRNLFHPTTAGFEVMSCHVVAGYQRRAASDCAPQFGGQLVYSLNGVRLVHLQPQKTALGALLDLLFNGFDPRSLVKVQLHSEVVDLADLTADDTGTVRGSVQVPLDTPAGVHRLTLTGTNGGSPREVTVLLDVPGQVRSGGSVGVYLEGFAGDEQVQVEYLGLDWGLFAPDAEGGVLLELPVPAGEDGTALPLSAVGTTTGTRAQRDVVIGEGPGTGGGTGSGTGSGGGGTGGGTGSAPGGGAPAPVAPGSTPAPTPASPSPSPSPTASPTGSQEPVTVTSSPISCPVPEVLLPQRTITATQPGTVEVRTTPATTVELRAYTRPSTTYRTVRTGTTDGAGVVRFSVLPPANTRLYAVVRGCESASTSQVLNVRPRLTLSAERRGPRDYAFRGVAMPGRPGGLVVSLYRVTGDGRQVLTAQARADRATGAWSIDRRFTGSGRFGFVVRTGQDLLNAPGASHVRPTLIH